MSKPRSLPKYMDDLAGFAGILRKRIFSSQSKAADHFQLNRSTIVRYENEELTPPLGYLTCLARLVIEQMELEEESEITLYRQTLLQQINKAVRYDYRDVPFQDWNELCAIADEYLARRQSPSRSAGLDSSDIQNQNIPFSVNLNILPSESPPLPHFYVERAAIQDDILHKIKHEQVRTLALWGQGGAGKSTLAAWLAKKLAVDFPDGQIWVELPENLSSDETVAEVQTQIGRRFGIALNGRPLAERAGQLRTLLSDKQCLLILDNVGLISGLIHLQVVNEKSCLLLTTRYRKLADVLEIPLIRITGMATEEGMALLTKWAEYPVKTTELASRLGGLPLALKLCGARLREGDTPDELFAYFHQDGVDLSKLDLDNPQGASEGLESCFSRSFAHLTPEEQLYFAQSGCFVGRFKVASSTQIWGIGSSKTRRCLRRLHSLALLEREGDRYGLHPLLRDYARQKLLASSVDSQSTHRRHAAYYIRHYLYHTQVLDDVFDEAPNLDQDWADVVSGVKWAAEYVPQLATIAALLAHTERPALLEAVGSSLTTAVGTYLSEIANNRTEQAILHELLGDLYLLSNDLASALGHFDQAAAFWQTEGDGLASSRARLRIAGIYLLHQNQPAAAKAVRQAQFVLAGSLPITETNLETARWLFYWFDIVYSVLVKSGDLDLLKKNVVMLNELAQKTGQPLLEARAWHIYRLFYTTKEVPHSNKARQKGRQFAARAAWLWWRRDQKDKALAEVMWTQEQTKGRRSQRMAKNFARRLSRATPKLSQEQIKLVKNKRLRWWLEAGEDERVDWLVSKLPSPGDDDWHMLDDILSISTTGKQVRRIARGLPRPDKHLVSEPMWKILTGQRTLQLAGETAIDLVKRYQAILEADLG